MKSKFFRTFCFLLPLLTLLTLALPGSNSKYLSAGRSVDIAAVWSDDPYILLGCNFNTDNNADANNGNFMRISQLTVKNGLNEGWYAFIIWGGDGGNGTKNGGSSDVDPNAGEGGVVKGIVYLDPGTYYLVAGAAGVDKSAIDDHTFQYSKDYRPVLGGGAGKNAGNYESYGGGGSGGGLSGIFKGGIERGPAPDDQTLSTLLGDRYEDESEDRLFYNVLTDCDAFDEADALGYAGARAIAIAGGGGGGAGRGFSVSNDYIEKREAGVNKGGSGGGYVKGGLEALGITSGGSSRLMGEAGENRRIYGTPIAEFGAGGMVLHAGGGVCGAAWNGGGFNVVGALKAVGGDGDQRPMHGGDANQDLGNACGGGGGGFFGGGAGGGRSNASNTTTAADVTDGGGGGGASYICRSNGGYSSYTFTGTEDKTGSLLGALYGNNATDPMIYTFNGNHGFTSDPIEANKKRALNGKIASYLNLIEVPRLKYPNSNIFAGCVVLAYLGPNDPCDANTAIYSNLP